MRRCYIGWLGYAKPFIPLFAFLSSTLSCQSWGKFWDVENSAVSPVAIISVRQNGTVHSGFLIARLEDASAISGLEVRFDGAGYQQLALSPVMKIALPSGTATWRDDSWHTVTLRAKTHSGNYFAESTLRLKKGANRDINGDGYTDLIVGASNYNSNQGQAFVFYSRGIAGLPGGTVGGGLTPAATITGTSVADSFGASLTLGDTNGDGYADVVIGAPGSVSGAGRVYVFKSAGAPGISSGAVPAANASTIINTSGMGFPALGCAVVTGDVNGDGFGDLILGARTMSSNTGLAVLLYSPGAAGFAASFTVTTPYPNMINGEATGNNFGDAVVAGDINGDGYADVAVGAASHTSNRGKVYVFHSGGAGGIAVTAAASANAQIQGEATGNYFGRSLALGDVTGDGRPDLMAGAYQYGSATGRVYVFHTAPSAGITATTAVAGAGGPNTTISGIASSDQFGFSIDTGDVNGDGFEDVAVGSLNRFGALGAGQGEAYVFHSGGAAGISYSGATSANTKIAGEISSSQFGAAVILTDVNGDGYADLVAGAPQNSHAAYVFHADAAAGIQATAAAGGGPSAVIVEPTTNFGVALR